MSVATDGLVRASIASVVAGLGDGPLQLDGLRDRLSPLFTRTLARPAHAGLGAPEVYLANHSLGRPLDVMADDVRDALTLWYERMDAAWVCDGNWIDLIDRFRACWAALIGLDRPDAIVPKTSAGQGLRAVLNALSDEGRVPNVLTTQLEFDSIDFILRMYASKGRADVTYVEPDVDDGGVRRQSVGSLIDAIDGGVDLVVVSHVAFGTGAVLEGVEDVIERAHECGAYVLLDTYHSAGVMPIGFSAMGPATVGLHGAHRGPDFAVGGSYKYVRGGPGACWLAINPRHLDHENEPGALRTLDTGWFAKKDTFAYERPDEPLLSPGGDAWLESTPPVLTAAHAFAGLEFTLAMGVDRLRSLNLGQQAVMRDRFKAVGVHLFEPTDPESYGAFALLASDDAGGLSDRLRAAGVNTDARGGYVRFGPDALTTVEEIDVAARITADILRA